jgi:hypothetical protein
VRCWELVLYLAFIVDVFSRMIVGWQLAANMRTDMVLDALKMAIGMRGPGASVGLVHHSDHGSQYTSLAYTQTLDDHGVKQSLGTVGDALDNALAESWVDSLKTELIADRVWRTRSQLEIAIVEYIGWFNHVRLHSSLGFMPPAEYDARRQVSQDEPLCARTAPALIEGRNAIAGLYARQVENTRSLRVMNSGNHQIPSPPNQVSPARRRGRSCEPRATSSCCSVSAGSGIGVSRLECDLGLFLGHLGVPQRPRVLELIPQPAARFTLFRPTSQPPFVAHPDSSRDRQRR